MQEILFKKLYDFIAEYNPDLLVALEDKRQLSPYIDDKLKRLEPLIAQLQAAGKGPNAIEAQCMDILTADLRPSRFMYVKDVLEEAFESVYYYHSERGSLIYEIINLLDDCNLGFRRLRFQRRQCK